MAKNKCLWGRMTCDWKKKSNSSFFFKEKEKSQEVFQEILMSNFEIQMEKIEQSNPRRRVRLGWVVDWGVLVLNIVHVRLLFLFLIPFRSSFLFLSRELKWMKFCPHPHPHFPRGNWIFSISFPSLLELRITFSLSCFWSQGSRHLITRTWTHFLINLSSTQHQINFNYRLKLNPCFRV